MSTEPTTEMMNEVIALFDSWQKKNHGGTDFFVRNDRKGTLFNSELKYHTSWDWLMPVVRKILHEVNAINTEVGLRDALYNCDLKATHKSCYQFIIWNNDNQQKQTNE